MSALVTGVQTCALPIYTVARALIGYAIHEVAHIRETDFDAIIRAIDEGRMEPDKLIKKFENAIEDYRIERITSQQFPGSVDDLTRSEERRVGQEWDSRSRLRWPP